MAGVTRAIRYSPADRTAMLVLMLNQGTEHLWRQGYTTATKIEVGRRLKTKFIALHFGDRQASLRLQMLVAEGMVKRGGRGRHAGWWLTEEGVLEAKRWKNPTATAVSQNGVRA